VTEDVSLPTPEACQDSPFVNRVGRLAVVVRISPHLHFPEISQSYGLDEMGDALRQIRFRVDGSDSDSPHQSISFSDVAGGMEAGGRNKGIRALE